MRRGFFTGVAALVCLFAGDAGATYSISAVDDELMLVGGAGTSCVGALQVSIIQATVPGVGVVHAQALVNIAGRDEAASLLSMGATAGEVIAAIANPGFDFGFEERQYGVVRLPDDAAAFTGADNMAVASHQYGSVGPHRYSVQGNILTSENVLTQAKTGFDTPSACDMAERLMLALEAGGENGEGDSRCTDDGIPADSAFIRIVDAAGTELIFIEVTDTFPENPMVPLREEFELWRVDNPCPDLPGGADEDGEDADSGDESEESSTGEGSTSDETGGGSGSSTGDGEEVGADTLGDASGNSTEGSTDTAQDGTKGCACSAREEAPASGLTLLGVGLLLLRRRRRSTLQA